MERIPNNGELERLVTQMEREELQRQLGNLGLVDASQYDYDNPDDAPNIFRGRE